MFEKLFSKIVFMTLSILQYFRIASPSVATNYLKRREFLKDLKETHRIIAEMTLLDKPFFYEPLRTTRHEVLGLSGLEKIMKQDAYNLDLLKERVAPVIMDIGSHIGIFPRVIKKKFPEAKIFSFEPDRDNFRILRLNNEMLDNVETHQKGIFEKEALIKLKVSDVNGWRSSLSINSGFFSNVNIGYDTYSFEEYNVQCISIDQFTHDQGISRIDLIGITVPGEIALSILRGASLTLESIRPIISISLYPEEVSLVKDFMKKFRYKYQCGTVAQMYTFCPEKENE